MRPEGITTGDHPVERAGNQRKLDFEHRFVPGKGDDSPTLLLLHGTGGDENDLVPLERELSPGASLLSPHGKVLEHGMPRFFRRLAEGVFDERDLIARTYELARFVEAATGEYSLKHGGLVAVGFSNGANIAASLMLLHPGLLKAVILLRATVPFEMEAVPDLARIPVYVAAGRRDELVSPEKAGRLAEILRAAGAEVELKWSDGGHGLTRKEVDGAKERLSEVIEAPTTPGNPDTRDGLDGG